MWTVLKVFIELVTILLLLYVLVFWLVGSEPPDWGLNLHPSIGTQIPGKPHAFWIHTHTHAHTHTHKYSHPHSHNRPSRYALHFKNRKTESKKLRNSSIMTQPVSKVVRTWLWVCLYPESVFFIISKLHSVRLLDIFLNSTNEHNWAVFQTPN